MKFNKIESIRFYRGSGSPSMTIHRTDGKRYYQYHGTSAGHLTPKRETAIFEGLKASDMWDMDVSHTTVEGVRIPDGIEVVFTPRTSPRQPVLIPLDIREKVASQHELLTYAFNFIDGNIDGRLEDWGAADRMWHMLGAVVGSPVHDQYGLGWTRLEHRAEFLKHYAGKLAPHIWDEMFNSILKW